MTDNPPTITIDGVPETITRDQYVALIEAVGLDANNLFSLRFATDGIYAEVFARDANGAKIIDHTPESQREDGSVPVAKHLVFIRVEDQVAPR